MQLRLNRLCNFLRRVGYITILFYFEDDAHNKVLINFISTHYIADA